jgi:hypothetical protein
VSTSDAAQPAVKPARTARRIAAALVAAALCAAAWVRVGAIEPSLRIRTYLSAQNPAFELWNVFVESHGGEAMDEVSIEPVSGPVTFDGGTSIPNLPAQWRVTFVVRITGPQPRTARVRVLQKGSSSQTYDVDLGGAP